MGNYIPNTAKDQKELLKTVGQASLENLLADIPAKARFKGELSLPSPLSEPELLDELTALSKQNKPPSSFLGGGSYNHFIPSVVKHLVSRSEFYTAYTPYQAEMSQGMLQAIYEYQSLICALTGMEAANASMYDGATALAEAAFLACHATGKKEIVISNTVNPEYRKVLKTYAKAAGLIIKEAPYRPLLLQAMDNKTACVIIQQPNFFGCIEEVAGLAEKIHAAGALFIVSVDPISLGILKSPGEYGADIVTGEGQSLGNPRSFGGPGLGIMAVKKELIRHLPGRVVGQTVDHDGKRGFCLTLQTREQHIRREKASSNICSNEALAALAACIYLSVMGKQGLKKMAELCLQKTNYLKTLLKDKLVFSEPTFKEFVVKSSAPIGIDLSLNYPDLKDARLVCVTELCSKASLDEISKKL